jgi:hypothetical protein
VPGSSVAGPPAPSLEPSLEPSHGPRQPENPVPGHVLVDGIEVGEGSRVRLRPSRGADAQDMFLTGRTALVRAVLSDVDGGRRLAVTLDDDEAADLLAECGLYRYFGPEEVEPL